MTTIDSDEITYHLSMYDPVVRKKSFKRWPFKARSSCSVTKMVEAGFYHIPDPVDKDTARCFFCCRTICGFEESDDPIHEHLRRSEDCQFQKFTKNISTTVTLSELSNLQKQRKLNYVSFLQNKEVKTPGKKRQVEEELISSTSGKKVRVSLSRNTCLTFKKNTTLECPTVFDSARMPTKSAIRTPPISVPEVQNSRIDQCEDLKQRLHDLGSEGECTTELSDRKELSTER